MDEHAEIRLRQLISEAAGTYWAMQQHPEWTTREYERDEERVIAYVRELIQEAKCPKPTPCL